jgi:hypothetical protein
VRLKQVIYWPYFMTEEEKEEVSVIEGSNIVSFYR